MNRPGPNARDRGARLPVTDVSNRCFEQQNFPLSSCTHLTVILALVTSRHIASTCPQKYERPLELSVLMAPFPAFRYNTSWSGELVTHNLHRARTNTCTQTALSACTFYSLCFVFATMKISTNSHWVSRDWWQSRRNSWCPSCTNWLPAHPPDVNVMWVVLNGGEIDVGKAVHSRQSKFRVLKLERVTLGSPRKPKWQSWLGLIKTYYYKNPIRFTCIMNQFTVALHFGICFTSSTWRCCANLVHKFPVPSQEAVSAKTVQQKMAGTAADNKASCIRVYFNGTQ